jgi:hypothetical protein
VAPAKRALASLSSAGDTGRRPVQEPQIEPSRAPATARFARAAALTLDPATTATSH